MSAAGQIEQQDEATLQTEEESPTKPADEVPLSSTSPVQSVLPVAFLMLEKTKIPSNPGCLSSFTNRVEDKWPHDQ